MTDRDQIIYEGVTLEELTQHTGWTILVSKLKEREDSLIRKHSQTVHDLNQLNFDNGRRRGLTEPLSIVQKAINLKEAALGNKDAAGRLNADESE